MEPVSPSEMGTPGQCATDGGCEGVSAAGKVSWPDQRSNDLSQGAQILKGIPIEGVSNSRHLLCHAEECNDEASGEGSLPSTPDSSLRSE